MDAFESMPSHIGFDWFHLCESIRLYQYRESKGFYVLIENIAELIDLEVMDVEAGRC